jgi:hypothetical protein
MIINDEQDNERSGYGLLNVNGQYRVVLGMDSARGQESVALATYDQGKAGLMVSDGQHLIYEGSALPNEKMSSTEEPSTV